MSNVGIKPSKKYAIGSVHENGTGSFEIIDRYLQENVIMLKFKWLNGEFTGKEDVNKESNINASIWKYKNVRGLNPSQKTEKNVVFDRIDEVIDKLDSNSDLMEKLFEEMKAQKEMIIMLQSHIVEIQKQAITNDETIKQLVRDNTIVTKLLDKI